MRKTERYLYLTPPEWRVMLLALNRLRDKLITQGIQMQLMRSS